MSRLTLLSLIAIIGLCYFAETSFAQPPPDRIFGYLDRNRNGRLDPEEMQRLPSSFKENLQKAGIKLDRSISRDDFIKRANEARARRESGKSSSSKKKVERPRVTVDLQENLLDRDHNKDGQISLHEWNRKAYAEFMQLDRNGDFVLTPKEIAIALKNGVTISDAGKKAAPSGSVAAAASKSSSTKTVSTPSKTSTSAKPSGAPLNIAEEYGPNTKAGRMARFMFKLVDKDKDTKISAVEWERSSSSKTFKKLGIELQIPATVDQYIAAYAKWKGKR